MTLKALTLSAFAITALMVAAVLYGGAMSLSSVLAILLVLCSGLVGLSCMDDPD